jgi:hypothetical protein
MGTKRIVLAIISMLVLTGAYIAVKHSYQTTSIPMTVGATSQEQPGQLKAPQSQSLTKSSNDSEINSPYNLGSQTAMSRTVEQEDEGLEKFKSKAIHIAWVGRVEALLGDKLSESQRKEIKKHHLILLRDTEAIKDEYLKGYISYETYMHSLSESFKEHQEFYKNMLNDDDYVKLFELAKEETAEIIEATLEPQVELQIMNPEANPQEVMQKVPAYKIEELISMQKKLSSDVGGIDNQLELKQINDDEALKLAESTYKVYIESARRILTPSEFELIFGKDLSE